MSVRAPLTGLLSAVLLAGCATTDRPRIDERTRAAAAAVGSAAEEAQASLMEPTDPIEAAAPDSMRWLYGSGEAAGVSIQAWRQLADYTVTITRLRRVPQAVVMGLDGEVRQPACVIDGRAKPFAAIFDVDETLILNAGYEAWLAKGNAYSGATWEEWERTGAPLARAVPGAVEGLRRLREAGVTPVFNTNRQYSAEGATAAIAAAGLGEAVPGETLFLRGDDGTNSGDKDGRRAMIAEKYCVIALAGDNLGDFADVFNAEGLGVQERRALAATSEYARLWGNGWFLLPNPVYGDSITGSIGEVFPPDQRWAPAATTQNRR
ncbi:5'-nucleotidase, lipoprotein e(P4) family [Qipengyuania atrilutea]|uniref:Acid phosphatase n=1 Tax=Qipengyuania atrilutea TaxID=2744473 RepID=A0A850HC85_9SPHN|nr:HAD family acid phosphatase [Actirhodobacter atriluteus]NVD44709.1 acid phosphatase [Actirhodobacter atriluteus]